MTRVSRTVLEERVLEEIVRGEGVLEGNLPSLISQIKTNLKKARKIANSLKEWMERRQVVVRMKGMRC